jgi:hypothetical protein
MNAVTTTAVAVVGGIGGRVVSNVLPVKDLRIKAAIPVILGIMLTIMGKRNAMLSAAGMGMATIGGAELLKQLAPNVALFQGETAAQIAYSPADVQEALSRGYITQQQASGLLEAAGYAGMGIEEYAGEEAVAMLPSEAQEPFATTQEVL